MSVSALANRPPYVQFEVRAEEDREASVAAGHFVAKDVVYALITPAGSKDVVERVAEDWLAQLAEQVKAGRSDPLWLRHYTETYKMWKEGQEVPTAGTPLKNWPGVSPAQFKALQHANLRTVEDVAAMNEEAITRVGMGGRALKDRAAAFLEAASGPGKVGEEVAALRVKNAELAANLADVQKTLAQLQAAQGGIKRPEPAAETGRLPL
jgi:hypothetical protein